MLGTLLDRNPRVANWLYGFKPPERGVVVLVHRRVYIVPARLGLFFAATLVVLLLGSINYALSLGFALTFLLGGTALAGMVHTARNLARTAIGAGRAMPVFAGEAAQFRLVLDSRVPYDRPAILVRHAASGAQTVVDVPRLAQVEAVLPVPARRRGWMPLGRVMLETRFPLGLFRAWSYVELDAQCLVYPRPERSPLPRPVADASTGTAQSRARGNEDFDALRNYQRSDSPRHVAWKAVARSQKMLTKQFAGEAASELWLEWDALSGLDVEERLSRLAGWVLLAERTGALYGVRLPGIEIAPSHGDSHSAACLRALALYPAEPVR